MQINKVGYNVDWTLKQTKETFLKSVCVKGNGITKEEAEKAYNLITKHHRKNDNKSISTSGSQDKSTISGGSVG